MDEFEAASVCESVVVIVLSVLCIGVLVEVFERVTQFLAGELVELDLQAGSSNVVVVAFVAGSGVWCGAFVEDVLHPEIWL